MSLDKSSATLTEGDELTLTATVNPDNATNKNVTWSSSDPSVASVSNGKVTALKAGKATITVKTDDGGKTATCEVTVNAKVYPVASVSLDKTSAELTEGDELTLTATVNPDNASNKNLTWISSDNSVASVVDGKVTAIKAGKATITVKTDDGGKTATCEVTVNAKVYPVASVSLDKTSAELTEGDELTLTATVNPDNASNKNLTWISSDNSVASVVDGKVTAIKAGKATITVKTDDGGKTATCEITVVRDPINNPIVFADEVMKGMCVAAFDTNGDGELSFGEARAVTDLSKMTLTNRTFKSFEEFQYFTSVKTIPSGYFSYCSFQSIILPESLHTIKAEAFLGCSNMTSINIPSGVISFGEWGGCVFRYCTSLTEVVFPNTIKTFLGSNTFEKCSNLAKVILPNNLDEIQSYMFADCYNLKSVNIPDKVKIIGLSAFKNCSNLTSINIPEGMLSINSSAFENCSKLETVTLPTSLKAIESSAFWKCSSLIRITIPEQIRIVNLLTFSDCSSLTEVILPEGLIEVCYSAFSKCTNLTSIVLPGSVTKIGEMAFKYCSRLSSVFVKSSIPPILLVDNFGHYSFEYNENLRKIFVPIDAVEAYKTAEGWSNYADDIVGYNFDNNDVVE